MHARWSIVLLLLTAGCANVPVDPLPDTLPSPEPGQRLELAEPPADASGTLAVHYLDVGQGDATIWRLPGGGTVLYDCGGDRRSDDKDPVHAGLEQLGVSPGDPIHMLIISHGHLDHVRECDEVLADYQVQHVVDLWYTGSDRTQAYRDVQQAALGSGARLHTVHSLPEAGGQPLQAGDRLPLPAEAEASGVVAQLLWPLDPATGSWDEIAEKSLVVRLSHGDRDLCFQGDIETSQEERLLAAVPGLACEVYLVGHHGSAHASTPAWVQALAPEIAVVSTGPNPYGHPTGQALCHVQATGASLHITHGSGTITVESRPSGLTVRPDRPLGSDPCQTGWSYWEQAEATSEQAAHLGQGGLTVAAAAEPEAPCQHSEVNVRAHVTDAEGRPVAGVNVTTTWHYRTSSPQEQAITGEHGWANTSRYISGASTEHEVRVEVDAWTSKASGQANATFQPRAC